MTSLAEIRARLLEQENKSQGKSGGSNEPSLTYPFWNIPDNGTATIRFLPDANEENIYFWKERQMIRIPFSGTDQDPHRETTVTVPCMNTWGEECPVIAETKPWWNDPALEDTARKYWKKRSYIFQGFVVDDPLSGEATPENPIRRFIINPSIFNVIKTALMDPDFPEIPTHYEQGTDFKLSKSKKGQYADYSQSNWARRERSLNEQERSAIDTHGLFDLNSWMPEKPTSKHLEVIMEMFEASVDGQPFRGEWAAYYKPWGYESSGSAPAAAPAPVAAPVVEATPAPASPAPAADNASDILAAIRARKVS